MFKYDQLQHWYQQSYTNNNITRCGQTDQQADIVTYRAAIAAKMQNITIE